MEVLHVRTDASFGDLPVEISWEVASHLTGDEGIKGLAQLAKTNRAFHEMITNNRAFVRQMMERNWEVLILANPELKTDPELIQMVFDRQQMPIGPNFSCRESPSITDLFQVPLFRKDKDVVLAAVSQNSSALEYASEELQADRDVVMVAVRQTGFALAYASNVLKADRAFMLEAVRQNGFALRYASAELKADREVVLAAVRQKDSAIYFASDKLQADLKVVLAAAWQGTCNLL